MKFDPMDRNEGGTFETCPFPKYCGVPWGDVVASDSAYVHWLISGNGPEMEDELYDFLEDLLTGDIDT